MIYNGALWLDKIHTSSSLEKLMTRKETEDATANLNSRKIIRTIKLIVLKKKKFNKCKLPWDIGIYEWR